MSKKSGPPRGSQQAVAGITEVVPWSVPVTLDQIPETGLHRAIEASEAVCDAIARLASLRNVAGLGATFDLTRRGGKVEVTGRVRARVGQTCVVSLEPMETDIDEAIDLTFAPPPAGAVLADEGASERPHKAGEETPEPLLGNSIDLGAIAAEFLVLAIDPYPRKEGAEFAPPAVEETGNKPFAALAALQKEPGKRNN
ncbi:YceD family protein [Undibacter mobilis]|uniref:DUF177 domain-containing protein n=1 Tax=Undibacter mobilis TaxID=2292256 RepID=A0A371B1L0_9BRAD|nr:DUF177 domain-containing protein [Undibacter mobilis]RDV01343.1 DUF177 domain-containing protein [Undibacter mobilis]